MNRSMEKKRRLVELVCCKHKIPLANSCNQLGFFLAVGRGF